MDLLNDIHKHIMQNSSSDSSPPFRRIDDTAANSESADKHDYEEGIVRGYAVHHPAPSGFVLPNNHANDMDYTINQLADSKTGFINRHKYRTSIYLRISFISFYNSIFYSFKINKKFYQKLSGLYLNQIKKHTLFTQPQLIRKQFGHPLMMISSIITIHNYNK